MAATPPPALPVELVEEILLRPPPDDPACLLRASVVCKTWGAVVSHRGFRRRLHELHRAPPVLGFFHSCHNKRAPNFVATTASSFSLSVPDFRSCRALDCRHGRALFFSRGAQELLVWELITGAQQRVPLAPAFQPADVIYVSAAVLCAADGCDHKCCHGCPFRLVFLFVTMGMADHDNEYDTSACAYSSETGTWGELTSVRSEFLTGFMNHSTVLTGRSLLYFMSDDAFILEYDLARNVLTLYDTQDIDSLADPETFNLVLAEEGGLQVSQEMYPHLKFWTREVIDGLDARWVLSRVINLGSLLQIVAVVDAEVRVVCFAEGANVIFVDTVVGLFTVELQSERVRKVSNDRGFCNMVPVVSFYTPAPRAEHQDPLLLSPIKEAGGEEGGEKEKTLDQAQQLFDKGSNAIKKGGSVNAFECFSHDRSIRHPCYGEVSLEDAGTLNIYGCTLLPKAQKVIDSSCDVPNSAPNKESVKGTSSHDDAGNSTTSDSNVNCGPPSEKVLLC
uniref:Uncharacterized protein n=1 Tax=Avena sativa TaxID=4498 RepID=A0ACD5X9U3_AVESA